MSMEERIRAMLAQVDAAQMRQHLYFLSKDPLPYRKINYNVPGHTQNSLYDADDFIVQQLESWGYAVEREDHPVQAFGFDPNKPKRHSYTRPGPDAPIVTAYNLYARKRGRRRSDEIILILAHKDSQSWVDSPGAYDNGVGTVAVLQLARVLAGYDSERSLWFLFCNEEHFPWTSIAAAARAREQGVNFRAVFNLDSLGGKAEEDVAAGHRTNVTAYTTPEGRQLAELMAEVNERYVIGLQQSAQQRQHPGDDDGSFIKAGYPAAVANLGSFPYVDEQYHLEGDIPERVDIENVRMAAQATLAAVLTLDAAP
jgi:hypothetical protein